MNSPSSFSSFSSSDPVKDTAAEWVARHDRGLSAEEAAAFTAWLEAAPIHRQTFDQLNKSWDFLDRVAECRPLGDAALDPDLLDAWDEDGRLAETPTPRSGWWERRWPVGLAAAAALAVMAGWFTISSRPAEMEAGPAAILATADPAEHPVAAARIAHEVYTAESARRQRLPDGSLVDLNAGTRLELTYSADRRDLQLLTGEAHFTVVKDSSRPFIVEAGGMRIRAVGTAFNVRLSSAEVEVLVTHGLVAVDAQEMAETPEADPFTVAEGALLSIGERAVVSLGGARPATVVDTVAPAIMASALAWQPQTLEFSDTPLAEAVGLFNGGNARQLMIGDPALNNLHIEGVFRLNNVDAFVRLLEMGFGVEATEDASGVTVLRAAR